MMHIEVMLKRGFTLIELLIVIAVLGILAVAVLSAINPIEQINRSRDTGSRSDSEQLLSAIDRFYATQSYYPWQTGPGDTAGMPVSWTKVTSSNPPNMFTNLSESGTTGTGELKTAFVSRVTGATYNSLFIYKGSDDANSVYVCFKPLSNSFQTEAQARCAAAPSDYPGSACGNTTDCGSKGNCICLP